MASDSRSVISVVVEYDSVTFCFSNKAEAKSWFTNQLDCMDRVTEADWNVDDSDGCVIIFSRL